VQLPAAVERLLELRGREPSVRLAVWLVRKYEQV
jgi:hypothetical protein